MEKEEEEDENIIFNLEIQIDDDNTATITIKENDDIEEVVDSFCTEYNLSHNIKQMIIQQVLDSIDTNITECKLSIYLNSRR